MSEGANPGSDPQYPGVLNAFLARNPDVADHVKLGLIKLLTADGNAMTDVNTAPGTHSEDDSEHFATAINLVPSLNDERAIPALARVLTTGGMATDGVMKYGRRALGPVLKEFSHPNPVVHAAAVDTAMAILRQEGDAPARAQAIEIARTALTDRHFEVRMAALSAIEKLEDRKRPMWVRNLG